MIIEFAIITEGETHQTATCQDFLQVQSERG